MGIVAFAVRKWQISLVLVAMLAILGLNSFLSIARSEDPQFNAPLFTVIAVLPGADPLDMEQLVVDPIEAALDGLDNVLNLRSTALDGAASISIEFDWSSDSDGKYDEIVRELNALRPSLPGGIASIEVLRSRPADTNIAQIALTSPHAPWREFLKTAERLKDRLDRIDGVRATTIEGAPTPEVSVVLDSGRLASLALPSTAAAEALAQASLETPVGAVHSGGRRLNLKTGGAFSDLQSMRDVVVASPDGRPIRIGDIASVDWGIGEPEQLAFHNGERAVFITVQQRLGANVISISDAIDEEIERFRPTLPGGIALHRGFDQSKNVEHRLGLLYRDFAIALGLVMITLAPLGWRSGFIVLLSIPLSLAIAILGLQILGYTLNQLTIAGCILSLGLLVDDSIVVVENIARRMREGEARLEAVVNGARQIAAPVIGCTLTLMLAFAPLLFLPGGPGAFIRALPVTVLLCVGASLAVALLFIPFISSRILPRDGGEEGNAILHAVQNVIHEVYRPILHGALARPWLTLAITALICLTSIPMLRSIGTSLFPGAEIPQILVRIDAQEGTGMETTLRMMREVETRLAERPEVEWYMSSLGGGNPRIYYNTPQREPRANYAEVLFQIDHYERDAAARFVADLRRSFSTIPGGRISVTEFEQGPPIDAPIAFRVIGEDLATLRRLSSQIERLLEETPGTRDVHNPMRLDRIDLDLGVDLARAGRIGVREGDILRTVRLAVAGETAARLIDDDGDAYPVNVRLPSALHVDESILGAIYVPSQSGAIVPLSQISNPRPVSGPPRIERYERTRAITITAWVEPGLLTSAVSAEAEARAAAFVFPPGYELIVAGETEARSDSFGGIGAAAVVAILGILGVLLVQFGSFRSALVVAGVIPLGIFGAVAALWLTGWSLSFTAAIGIVALIGIEIKNSILLVDFAEQLRREGVPLRPAIEQAGEIRFLPVVLTSVTAIGGLLPLALEGSGLSSPLAWAIIGGLVSSTFLSRIATPAMYLILADRREPEARTGAAREIGPEGAGLPT